MKFPRWPMFRQRPPHGTVYALVRVTPRTGYFNQFDSILLIIMFGMQACIFILSSLSMLLSGYLVKFWIVLHRSWFLLVPFLRPDSPTQSQIIDESFMAITVGFVIFMMVIFILLRRQIRYFRAMHAFRRGEMTHPLLLSKYLRLPFLSWFSIEKVIDAPSPTTVLDVLQSMSDNEISPIQIYPSMYEDNNTLPVLTYRLKISENVELQMIGAEGKQENISIKNAIQAGILTFLAIQPKGEWIARDKVLSNIYEHTGDDVKNNFRSQIHRLNQDILGIAQDSGLIQEAGLVELFEKTNFQGKPSWRLCPECEVVFFTELETFHQRIQEIQDHPEYTIALDCKDYFELGEQAITCYGKGLLDKYQHKHRPWRWISNTAKIYRNKCIDIVEFSANQVREKAEHLADPHEYEQALQGAAKLYGTAAQIVGRAITYEVRGELNLQHSLKLYKQLNDLQTRRTQAINTYKEYASLRLLRDTRWSPNHETIKIWPELLTPLQEDLRKEARESTK